MEGIRSLNHGKKLKQSFSKLLSTPVLVGVYYIDVFIQNKIKDGIYSLLLVYGVVE